MLKGCEVVSQSNYCIKLLNTQFGICLQVVVQLQQGAPPITCILNTFVAICAFIKNGGWWGNVLRKFLFAFHQLPHSIGPDSWKADMVVWRPITTICLQTMVPILKFSSKMAGLIPQVRMFCPFSNCSFSANCLSTHCFHLLVVQLWSDRCVSLLCAVRIQMAAPHWTLQAVAVLATLGDEWGLLVLGCPSVIFWKANIHSAHWNLQSWDKVLLMEKTAEHRYAACLTAPPSTVTNICKFQIKFHITFMSIWYWIW